MQDNSYWFVRRELSHMIFELTGRSFHREGLTVGLAMTAFFAAFPEVTLDRYCDVLRRAPDSVKLWLLDYLIDEGF